MPIVSFHACSERAIVCLETRAIDTGLPALTWVKAFHEGPNQINHMNIDM